MMIILDEDYCNKDYDLFKGLWVGKKLVISAPKVIANSFYQEVRDNPSETSVNEI